MTCHARTSIRTLFAHAALMAAVSDPLDAETAERAEFIAICIPSDVDLDDVAEVALALLGVGLCAEDFGDVIDEAIEIARADRWRVRN